MWYYSTLQQYIVATPVTVVLRRGGWHAGCVAGHRAWRDSGEGSTREYEFFGVEGFSSIEALQGHMTRQREMGFTAHLEETTVIGTPWEPEVTPPDDS